jgi:hypothetical protein
MASARRIGLLVVLALVSRSVTAAPRILRVTGDRVCLRAQPAPAAEVVGQMMAGDLLTTPDDDATGEWVRVVAPPSIDLWIYSELLRDGRITVNKAQVRGGPGLQFKRVGELERETPLVIRGTLGDWTRIAPTPECHLWISRAYTTPLLPVGDAPSVAPSPASPASAVAAAPRPSADVEEPSVPRAVPVPLPTETVAPPVPPAAAPPNPETTAAAAPVPPAPVTTPPAITLPRLPPLLAGYTPDAHRPQNRPARFTGRLTRILYATAPGYSGYQVVADAPRRGRGEPLCRLIGLEGQLQALVGCQVDVQGNIWHLAGEPAPVLDARRLLMLAPPP